MQDKEIDRLDKQLTEFLEDLLKPMGRVERQHWGRLYVQGLLLNGERKSVELPQRIPGADVQSLRQFVGQSPWAVATVQKGLAGKLKAIVPDAEVWIVDETGFPKAGTHSVGVARQYCGILGKVANCQVAVSLHLSSSTMLHYAEDSRCFLRRLLVERARLLRCLATIILAWSGLNVGNGITAGFALATHGNSSTDGRARVSGLLRAHGDRCWERAILFAVSRASYLHVDPAPRC